MTAAASPPSQEPGVVDQREQAARAADPQRGPSRGLRRRVAVGVGGLALIVVAAFVLGPPVAGDPYDPRSTEPDGLRGLVELLEAFGVSVDVSTDLPVDGSASILVPIDRTDAAMRDRLRTAAEAGAVVVVGGDSLLHDGEPAGTIPGTGLGRTERRPGCALLEDVGPVVQAGWSRFALSDEAREQGAVACFGTDDDADATDVGWLLAQRRGAGLVVGLGSVDPFTNTLLDEGDNVVLAARLLGAEPGARLVILEPPAAGEGDTPLLELIPAGVIRALWLLAAALVTALLWRARRLGPPVAERLPPVLPSAELARSVGGLLHRRGDRIAVAGRLREQALRDARLALRIPLDTPAVEVVALLTNRTAVAASDAQAALLDELPDDDAGLAAVGRQLARVRADWHRPPDDGSTDPGETR